jgi:hypothetical protein
VDSRNVHQSQLPINRLVVALLFGGQALPEQNRSPKTPEALRIEMFTVVGDYSLPTSEISN